MSNEIRFGYFIEFHLSMAWIKLTKIPLCYCTQKEWTQRVHYWYGKRKVHFLQLICSMVTLTYFEESLVCYQLYQSLLLVWRDLWRLNFNSRGHERHITMRFGSGWYATFWDHVTTFSLDCWKCWKGYFSKSKCPIQISHATYCYWIWFES